MKQRVYLKEVFSELFVQEKEELSTDKEEVLPVVDKIEELTPDDEITLKDLEIEIEDAINKSIEADSETLVKEGANVVGFAYEGTVIKAIKKAGFSGDIKKGAGASAAAADADFKVSNVVYKVEVKLNTNAQMGGSSIKYHKGTAEMAKPVDPAIDKVLAATIKTKASSISKLLKFISSQSPKAVNSKVNKFPLACTKNAWEKASKNGLLVNTRIKQTTKFIEKHYAEKGIFYIQIGGAGLFYMAKNPASLPIPKLEGNINIEIRSARSGTKPLANGTEVVGGGIRVQARLKTKSTSPYTMDDPVSIAEMMAVLKKRGSSRSLVKEMAMVDEKVDYSQALLYKAFIQPFTDIAATALHGVSRVATKTLGELGSLAKQTAMFLIPFVGAQKRKEIRRNDKQQMAQRLGNIDAKFKNVLTRNWTTLNELDVWGTLFLVAPQVAIGEKLLVKAPEVALDLLSVLVGGAENGPLMALKNWYNTQRTGGEYGKGQAYQGSSFSYGGMDGMGGGDWGGGMDGGFEEQVEPQQQQAQSQPDPRAQLSAQLRKLLQDPAIKQKIAASPITKALQQEAVSEIVKDAQEALKDITFEALKQKAGPKFDEFMKKQLSGGKAVQTEQMKPTTPTEQKPVESAKTASPADPNAEVKKLEQDPKFQKGVVDTVKAGLKEPYIKQLQALVKTNPAMNQAVSAAIQQIKAL